MLNLCFDIAMNDMLKLAGQENVTLISMFLEFGDLSAGVFSARRENYVKTFCQDPWLYEDENHYTLLWPYIRETHEEILDAARRGEEICIWHNFTTESYCSYLYFVSLLKDFPCKISVVGFHGGICGRDYSAQVLEAAYAEDFTWREAVLTPVGKQEIASQWADLCKSPLPLRVLISGTVLSVPEDFYDNLIRIHIPEGAFPANSLLLPSLRSTGYILDPNFVLKRICHVLRTDCRIVGNRETRANDPVLQFRFIKK